MSKQKSLNLNQIKSQKAEDHLINIKAEKFQTFNSHQNIFENNIGTHIIQKSCQNINYNITNLSQINQSNNIRHDKIQTDENLYSQKINDKLSDNENYSSYINSLSNSIMNPLTDNISIMHKIEKYVLMNYAPYFIDYITNQLTNNPCYQNGNSTSNHGLNNENKILKLNLNKTELIKESIDNFFSSNDSKINNLKDLQKKSKLDDQLNNYSRTINHSNDILINKKKRPLEDLFCTCDLSFDSLEALTLHLKQTNHKAKSIEKRTGKSSPSAIPQYNPNNSKKKMRFNKDNDIFSNNSDDDNLKMVRGQEEWTSNPKKNNFISQILKCLECSESFETLADLSVHMSNSNHFYKYHPTNNYKSNSNGSSYSNKASSKKTEEPRPKSKKFTNNHSQLILPVFVPQSTSVSHSNMSCRLRYSIINQIDLSCIICNKKFVSQPQQLSNQLPPLVKLIQHLQNTHSIKNICTNCGAIFDKQDDLQIHLAEENNILSCNHIKNLVYSNKDAFKQSKKEKVILDLKNNNKTEDKHFDVNLDNNFQNHPLLALQMFVNRNRQSYNSSIEKKFNTKNKVNEDKVINELRLPAKKRPYLNDDRLFCNDEKDLKLNANCSSNDLQLSFHTCSPNPSEKSIDDDNYKRIKIENDNDNYISKENKFNTNPNLNILQKMQMNLDHYLT